MLAVRLPADRRRGYNASSFLPARVSVMNLLRHRVAWVSAACLVASFAFAMSQKTDKEQDAKKPKLTLRAQPAISMSPAHVVVTAELIGGADDYEDFYCPTVAWDWGDETQSESTSDCDPYEPGKSEIKRHFTKDHVFRAGAFRISFRLKQHSRSVGTATVSIQVRPGLRDTGQ
jgi:hypothetical protein